MTDLLNNEQNPQPTEPTPSVLGTPPAEPNPTDPPVEPTEPPAATGAPESIDGYEVNVEGFNFDEFKAIEENQAFLNGAREAGLDNKALNFVLDHYNQLLPKIMEHTAALDNEACVSTMKETWGADTDTNFGFAQAAANNAIQNGILTPEEVNSPEFGNNPLVLKMAAYFGQQLNEDTPPSNTQQNGAVDIQSLMSSEAYMNESHPDHKRVYAEVQKAYSKSYR
jgi:hypothetical protein